jgi:hypothetical protein
MSCNKYSAYLKYRLNLHNLGRRGRHIGFWWEIQKRPLRRPRRRREDNIKMDLREIGLDTMDWTDLAQERDQWRALVNTVMKLRVP